MRLLGLCLCLFALWACSKGGSSSSGGSLSGRVTYQGASLDTLFARLAAQRQSSAPEHDVYVFWQSAQVPEQVRQRLWVQAAPQPGWGGSERYRLRGDLRELYRTLTALPGVHRVSIAPRRYATFIPTDANYAQQWGLRAMGLEAAWDITRGSNTVRVAVIDTGIDPNHPAFAGRLAEGYDFISSANNAGDGDGRDRDPTDTALDRGASHGTHVSGILGANADADTVVGVDHHCVIMPVRTIGREGSYTDDYFDALVYAGDLDDADLSGFSWFSEIFPKGLALSRPRPSAPADVINLSLGGVYDLYADTYLLTVERDLLAALHAKGIVVVAAAGNDGAHLMGAAGIFMPAAASTVIAVGASTSDATRANYSNYGAGLDVVAPGGDDTPEGGILSTNFGGGTLVERGTSMASPHVAGLVSLLKAQRPSASPDLLRYLVEQSTQDLETSGWDAVTGWGLVRADLALGNTTTQIPPYLRCVDAWLVLDTRTDRGSVRIGNAGGTVMELGALSASSSAAWLSVGAIGSTGAVPVQVQRDLMSSGMQRAVVTVTSSLGGSDFCVVIAQNGRPGLVVELLDADWSTLDSQTVPDSGDTFFFTNVPAGSYRLGAGEDLNGDGLVDNDATLVGIATPGIVRSDSTLIPLSSGQQRSGLVIDLQRFTANQ